MEWERETPSELNTPSGSEVTITVGAAHIRHFLKHLDDSVIYPLLASVD